MSDQSPFLSPAQFFAEMGGALSKATLWRRIQAGDIKSIQLGGRGCRRLIPKSELIRILNAAPKPQASHLARWHENTGGA